jgi:hypothetical protein
MPRRSSLMRPRQTQVGVADGIQFIRYESMGEKLNFEQLLDLEYERTELYEKARDFDQFKIARAFVGTILPALFTSPLSWAMAVMYVIIRVLLRKKVIHIGNDIPTINSVVVSIVGGFMSFFLVFFLSQAYTRFMAQYTISKSITRCITRCAMLSRCSLPYAEALRIVRYLSAAHIVGYCGLSSTYSIDNLFIPMNKRYHLLTEKEFQRIKSIDIDSGPKALREIIAWCFDIIYRTFDYGNVNGFENLSDYKQWKFASLPRKMDTQSLTMLLNSVSDLNGSFTELFNYTEQTFPFSYMHLLVFINTCYLILITYTIATFIAVGDSIFPDLLGAFILFCNFLFVTGMREIGGHMIDPYGSDITDLPIISYIQAGYKSSLEILHANQLPAAELEDELQIHAQRPKLGAAFIAEPSLKDLIAVMTNKPDKPIVTSDTTESKNDDSIYEPPEVADIENGIIDNIRTVEIAHPIDKDK